MGICCFGVQFELIAVQVAAELFHVFQSGGPFVPESRSLLEAQVLYKCHFPLLPQFFAQNKAELEAPL